MANFNEKKKAPKREVVKNHEGGIVYSLKPLEDLFSKVLGSFFAESTYYEKRSAEDEYKILSDLIDKVPEQDKEYVLKIAKLGRMNNMIQYPLEVLSCCYNKASFKGESSKLPFYTPSIVLRAKDVLDILATQISMYGFDSITKIDKREVVNIRRQTPLPMQLRKCLKKSIEKMDSYQLSKGLGENSNVSMADAIKLLHPRPMDKKRDELYQSIIEGKLKFGANKKQVQSELVKNGQKKTEESKKELVSSIKDSTLFAIVKNLVALHKEGALNDEKTVKIIVEKLLSPKEIKASKMLPFRFYSAYQEIADLSRSSRSLQEISNALVLALDLSVVNLDDFGGYTCILIDVSGSMEHPVSDKSKITARDIALILGAIAHKKSTSQVYVFATKCEQITKISKHSTVMDIVKEMKRIDVGGGTNLNNALSTIKGQFDNLVILTDNDCHDYENNKLSFGERSNKLSDSTINKMIREDKIKRVWLNNLLGNSYAVINTDSSRKNLITGFSEKFIETINIYNAMGGTSDIRKVIDKLLRG